MIEAKASIPLYEPICKVIPGRSISEYQIVSIEERFIILKDGEIVNNANGYGYQTEKSAKKFLWFICNKNKKELTEIDEENIWYLSQIIQLKGIEPSWKKLYSSLLSQIKNGKTLSEKQQNIIDKALKYYKKCLLSKIELLLESQNSNI